MNIWMQNKIRRDDDVDKELGLRLGFILDFTSWHQLTSWSLALAEKDFLLL
jgi:hypothetical protein